MQKKLPITELDFFSIKEQLKTFLRNDQTGRFKDFDFEGSNTSLLLDVLAYNTYQNNFYTNMAISEMFLDSAQLLNSVTSHAKELNYLPRSARSSKAIISVSIKSPSTTTSAILVPSYTKFSSAVGSERYSFHTSETYLARRSSDGVFVADNIEIFEGDVITEELVMGHFPELNLMNKNIDTNSIRVFSNFNLNPLEYTVRSDIFGVNNLDPVFYIEPAFDERYKITFGNNKFGRNPSVGETITVFYRVSNGSKANGNCKFTTLFAPNVTVKTVSNPTGGADRETIENIKFFAPKSIQVQERAVTHRDYEILLKQRFNEIKDVSVFGGDELDPPRYGKVAIAVNVDGSLSDIAIRRFTSFLQDKTPIAIQPVFIDPKFMYSSVNLDVFYKLSRSQKSESEIEQNIRNIIKDYSALSLGKFGSIFEISRLSREIDDSDYSITSSTMSVTPYVVFSPEFNRKINPVFNFDTVLDTPCRFAARNRSESYKSYVKSSPFVFNGSICTFEDNGLGVINIIQDDSRKQGIIEIVRRNAGVVNYEMGVIKLIDFKVTSYTGEGIKVFASTKEINVTSPKDTVLMLLDKDININVHRIDERR